MAKDDRSGLNPFTGEKHLDLLNDDNLLRESYGQYRNIVSRSNLLDNTTQGQAVTNVARRLIGAIEEYLLKIGRYDYIENYYDWEFHLVGDNNVNAFCMPGGKIVVFSGILGVADTEEKIAFILAHEISHALLDHSRTQQSARTAKTGIEIAALVGSIALDLTGHHELADVTRGATLVGSIGSEFLLMKPFGRGHEIEADKLGMMIMYWAGYDIHNIPAFWQAMSAKSPNNHDFFSTHPSDSKRIEAMRELISEIDSGVDFYSNPVLSKLNSKVATGDRKTIGFNSDSAPALGVSSDSYNSNNLNTDNFDNSNTGNFNPQSRVLKDKFCTNCGTPAAWGAFFCTNCGNKLDVKCPKCGTNVSNPDASFCTNCGFKLEF
ncbi:MAG: M48 family metallopeptidase [archaeon]|nr:M48 family metallopeptidase [archaeon]